MDLTKVMATCRISVVSIGIIGNLLTFIIFSRPAFRKNSISTYCRALAICDCFTIYQLISDIGYLFFNYFLPQKSDWGCKLNFYITLSFSSITAWILIAFSIDKVLSMKNRAKFIKKKPFQYSVIIGIILFFSLLYIEIPMLLVRVSTSNNTAFKCDISSLPFGGVLNLVHLIDASFIPFITMIFSSIISIRMIRNSAKTIQRHVNAMDILNRTTRDLKYAVTSISLNVMFLVLKTPLTIVSLLLCLKTNLSSVTINVTLFIYFINFSSGIFVHLASNSIFRREFFIFLRLRKTNQNVYLNQNQNQNLSILQNNFQTMNSSSASVRKRLGIYS